MCEKYDTLPPYNRPPEPPAFAKAIAALRLAAEAFREAVADLERHECWAYRNRDCCDWCISLEEARGSLWSVERLVTWIDGQTVEWERTEALYAALSETADRFLEEAPAFGGGVPARRRRKAASV